MKGLVFNCTGTFNPKPIHRKELREAVRVAQLRRRERVFTQDDLDEVVDLYKRSRRWAKRHGIDPDSVSVLADAGAVCTTYTWPGPEATNIMLNAEGFQVARQPARQVLLGDSGMRCVMMLAAPHESEIPKWGTFNSYDNFGLWVFTNTEVEDVEI